MDVTSQVPAEGLSHLINLLGQVDPSKLLPATEQVLKQRYLDPIVRGVQAPHQALESTWANPVTSEQLIQPAQDIMQAASVIPTTAPANSAGVFLGPMGVRMLELQRGGPLPEHPAAVANAARYGEPLIKDQALREQYARGLLNMHKAAGLSEPPGTFEQSGWFMGADGKLRREIPDLGAKLVPTGNPNEYLWQHPIGDLHKAYDVPPIKVEEGSRGGAGFNWKTRQIIARPTGHGNAALAYANKVVPHEFQHAIQNAEGMAQGGSPLMAPLYKEYYQDNPFSATYSIERNIADESNPYWVSPQALDTYKRFMGETEARNVGSRRGAGYNYLTHPSTTEDIPRNMQITPYNTTSFPQSIIDALNRR
jgi:hypothetical protein